MPRTELGVGPMVALEGSYLLPMPELRDRLRVASSIAFLDASARTAKIIPGRGYDAGFTEHARLTQVELSATYEILQGARPSVEVGAGYALGFASVRFTAFNSPSTEQGASNAGFLLARALLQIEPGQLFFETRYAEARASLGRLGSVGTSDLSGFQLALGYSIDF